MNTYENKKCFQICMQANLFVKLMYIICCAQNVDHKLRRGNLVNTDIT